MTVKERWGFALFGLRLVKQDFERLLALNLANGYIAFPETIEGDERTK